MAQQTAKPNTNWELGHGFFGGIKGPDPHDARDFTVSKNARKLQLPATVPAEANFNHLFYSTIYNQENIGSCVAWGWKRVREFITVKAGNQPQLLSALAFYAKARIRAGYPVTDDTGLYIRDGEKELRAQGYAREEDYPYDTRKAFVDPPASAMRRSPWYKNVRTYRIESLLEMKAVIAAKHPVVFGVDVHENFWDAAGTGHVPEAQGGLVGGHCWPAAHYIDDASAPGGGYLWGPNQWGDFSPGGLLRLSYNYLLRNDAFPDMWTAAFDRGEQPPEM